MNGLKGPIECGGRTVTVFSGNFDDFYVLFLQIHGGKRHFPPADVFGKRNPGHVRKHSLEMIRRAAGNTPQLICINGVRQVPLDIADCII